MKRRIGEIGSNIAAKTGAGSNAVRFPPEMLDSSDSTGGSGGQTAGEWWQSQGD